MNYQRGQLEFIDFTSLHEEVLIEILSWRNHETIRRWMLNSEIISKKNHLLFVNSLRHNRTSYYWLIFRKAKKCGVVTAHFKENQKTCEWGFYLAPQFLGTGIGLELAFESIHLFFEIFRVRKLQGIVKKNNEDNINMQRRFGYTFKNIEESSNLFASLSFDDYIRLPKNFTDFKTSFFNLNQNHER